MTETNVFELTQPGTFSDPLTEVLRNGARTLLGQAVEAEVAVNTVTHHCLILNMIVSNRPMWNCTWSHSFKRMLSFLSKGLSFATLVIPFQSSLREPPCA